MGGIIEIEDIPGLPCFIYKERIDRFVAMLDYLFGITHFNFSRLHKNWGAITLYNGLEFSLAYWTKYCYTDFQCFIQNAAGSEYLIYDNELKTREEQEFSEVRQKVYSLPLGVIFIKYGDVYVDSWHFASNKLEDPISTIFRKTIALRKICNFFYNEFSDILLDRKNYLQLNEKRQMLLKKSLSNSLADNIFLRESDEELDPLLAKFIQKNMASKNIPKFTIAEMRIFYWATKGLSAKQIADVCYVSSRTVEKHLLSVRRKLDCRKTSAAITKAINMGIIHTSIIK